MPRYKEFNLCKIPFEPPSLGSCSTFDTAPICNGDLLVITVTEHAWIQAANVITIDELVGHAVTLLEKSDPVRDKLQARSRFVLVDEVQDCDCRQYRLVQLLSARHGNVFFVGDPNQSIYAFRGAQVRS